MKVLVIGGTQFVGRHFAEAAMRAGHQVTLFHRGSKGLGSVEGAEDVLGDRTENLDRLEGRQWDVVMDSSAYTPAVAGQSARALADCCGRYMFVSSISVYAGDGTGPIDENSELVPIGDPNAKEITGETYGYLKVLCEREIVATFGPRSIIVRPGIVAGSFDPTNRFTYWVTRFVSGGEVLVPDIPKSKLQLVDSRDLGEFMVRAAEQELTGNYNVAGPSSTFGQMIENCGALNPAANPIWVDVADLDKSGVRFGADLPLASLEGEDRLFSASSAAAIAKGLTYRTLTDTAHDVIEWKQATVGDEPPRAGMSRERELEVLANLRLNG
jgi:2'-hydroxyisoflavone reductase